jgi:hypothetical protein
VTKLKNTKAKVTEGRHSGFYFRPEDIQLLEALKKRLGLDQSELVRLALRVLARKEEVVV